MIMAIEAASNRISHMSFLFVINFITKINICSMKFNIK